jgi:hypothetical protein
MDVFDEPGSIVQPVGVKSILKGHEIPAGTRTPDEYQEVPCREQRLNVSFSGIGVRSVSRWISVQDIRINRGRDRIASQEPPESRQ